jgi:hypothetical protein
MSGESAARRWTAFGAASIVTSSEQDLIHAETA